MEVHRVGDVQVRGVKVVIMLCVWVGEGGEGGGGLGRQMKSESSWRSSRAMAESP